MKLYHQAQLIDEWEGEDYDGTSVRAGAKVMQRAKRIGVYRFARTMIEARGFLIDYGPLVMGTNWFVNMFKTDRNGYVNLGGSIAGGHAYLCIGYSLQRRAFRCLNSWGEDWGQRGRFWVDEQDMSHLIHDYGEACSAVELPISDWTPTEDLA